MRLSVKISIIICGLFLLMVALLHLVTTGIILGSFEQLEEKNARINIERVLNTLKEDLSGLESTGGDWAGWNETRDFINGLNKKYIENNLNVTTLENLYMDFILYFDSSGETVHTFAIQLDNEGHEIPISEELVQSIRDHKSFFIHMDAKDARTGIFLLSEDTALITAWPISNNEMEGPISGTLAMGRYLREDEIKSLEERTQLNVEFHREDNDHDQDDFTTAKAELTKSNVIAINRELPESISSYTYLRDIWGKDSLILKVTTSRDVYKQGLKTTNYFRWVQFLVGMILLAALLLTLQYAVLKPVLRLKEHVLSVGKSGDLSARISLKSRDEIGALAVEFNRMLEQLSDARNRLMEQSYYSGIGEMASGILHNFRNILTPMVGQIGKIRNKLKEASIETIGQAVDELNSGKTEEGREKSLRKYLSLAVPRISNINQDIDKTLNVLSGQAAHMEEVLSQQDKFAYYQKALEPLKISMIIDDAVKLMPHNLINAADIHREEGLARLPHVSAERVVLLQVLTNILNNATESILRKGQQKGNIWISGTSETEGEVQKVHIVIRDDGEGIDKEEQKKIFNRRYSTKTPISSGIGLHWCSNVLSAMKADIFVESEGLGYGCSIHIRIPADHNRSFTNAMNRRP